MQVSVITRPAADLIVVPSAEVLEHIRVADANESNSISLYVRSAQASCAKAGRILFGDYTLRATHPRSQSTGEVRMRYYLPSWPRSIVAARLRGGATPPVTLDPSVYEFEESVRCFRWVEGPPDFAIDFTTLEIDYLAGITESELATESHADLRFAVIEAAADRFVNRAAGIPELPALARSVCKRYRHSPLTVDMYA